MFYAHSAEIVPYEVEIPKCIVPCPLHKLSHITQYVRSVNWDTQCFEQKDDWNYIFLRTKILININFV